MKSLLILLTIFFIGCNPKIHPNVNYSKLHINKNYIFCYCLNKVNRRFNLEFKNLQNKSIIDGSIEVYFIDDNFDVEIDSVEIFISNYLDSLESNSLFRSYNQNSLGVAKCLNLYNSQILQNFLIKEFSHN